MIRDFTFIDDISESLFRIIKNQRLDKYFDTNNPNPKKLGSHRILILVIQNQYL